MDRPCCACGGRCGARWQRAVHDSWDYKVGHWAGRCALPDEQQRPYNHAAAYAFLIDGYVKDVYSVERFLRLLEQHVTTPGMELPSMRADVRALLEDLLTRTRATSGAPDHPRPRQGDAALRDACRAVLRRLDAIIHAHQGAADGRA
ncbi:MAG: hypothetical protein ACYDAB_14475 [bacterium]